MMPTERLLSLNAELRDAWTGEGNSARVTFHEWLEAMADNNRGTLQDAAREYIALERGCDAAAELLEALAGFASAVWSGCRLPGEMRGELAALYHNAVLPAIRKARGES
jgi:hypothetical protein